MFNSESIPRNQSNQSSPPKAPGSQKRKPSIQHQQPVGWGWPRFVSVEVDVEEKRRQKKNEAMPVTATAELSRPEQGARNQSFQKAHEQMSHSQPHLKSSRKPDSSDESNRTTPFASEEYQHPEHGSAAPAADRRVGGDAQGTERKRGHKDDTEIRTNNQESLDASQVALPPENERSTAESPLPEAAPEPEAARKTLAAEREDTKQEAQHASSPVERENSTQEKRPHRSSMSSRPQENDTTPGAFPDDDNESIYSEISQNHGHIQEASGVTNKPSTNEPEDTKKSISPSQDDFQGHPAREGVAEGKAQPISPRSIESSETGGNKFSKERIPKSFNEGHGQPHPSTDPPGTLPARESHNSVGAASKPPTRRSTARDSTSAKADRGQQSDASSGLWVPISDYATERTADSTTEEPAARESYATPAGERPELNRDAGSEEASRDIKATHPIASEPSAALVNVEQEDGGEKERSGLDPERTNAQAVPGIAPESVEASQGGKKHERSISNREPANEVAAQEGESRLDESPRSKPEPADVAGRIGVPASISARSSSKSAKKVTLPPPKIFVQSPSEATQDELAEPHPTPAEQMHNDEYRVVTRNGSVVSVQHTVTSAAERLGPSRTKKRKLYLRKARNLAARRVFLNATLGKKMGGQTKDKLRRLARGEEVPSVPVSTQAPAADSPPLRKRKSFIRKARNVAARQVFLDAALGRQVAGETKPVLRRMANGESIVADGA